jgi:hypothetical protein
MPLGYVLPLCLILHLTTDNNQKINFCLKKIVSFRSICKLKYLCIKLYFLFIWKIKNKNIIRRKNFFIVTFFQYNFCLSFKYHSLNLSLYMSQNAEDAYWPNLVSLFRVTYWAYCEFLSDLFGRNFVHIIDSPILALVRIYFGLTGCPKNCLKNVCFSAKYQYFNILVSLFRVTYEAYCEFLSDLFGKTFVLIINSSLLAQVRIYF